MVQQQNSASARTQGKLTNFISRLYSSVKKVLPKFEGIKGAQRRFSGYHGNRPYRRRHQYGASRGRSYHRQTEPQYWQEEESRSLKQYHEEPNYGPPPALPSEVTVIQPLHESDAE